MAYEASYSASPDDDGFSDNFFDDDGRVLGNRRCVAAARDLVDQFLANIAAHLSDTTCRDGNDDTAHQSDKILRAAIGACLLAVEKAGEIVNRRCQDHAAEGANQRRRQRAETEACGDGPEPAERRDED